MGEVLSLSKARKVRAKGEKERAAAENRIRFGRTKAEKAQDQAVRLKAESKLDDHKRDP